jgi:hypothetical protein
MQGMLLDERTAEDIGKVWSFRNLAYGTYWGTAAKKVQRLYVYAGRNNNIVFRHPSYAKPLYGLRAGGRLSTCRCLAFVDDGALTLMSTLGHP